VTVACAGQSQRASHPFEGQRTRPRCLTGKGVRPKGSRSGIQNLGGGKQACVAREPVFHRPLLAPWGANPGDRLKPVTGPPRHGRPAGAPSGALCSTFRDSFCVPSFRDSACDRGIRASGSEILQEENSRNLAGKKGGPGEELRGRPPPPRARWGANPGDRLKPVTGPPRHGRPAGAPSGALCSTFRDSACDRGIRASGSEILQEGAARSRDSR